MLPPINNPLDGAFWTNENLLLWGDLDELAVAIVTAGADNGARLMPPGVQVLVDWDVINEWAINYLREYRLSWVNGINDTTRRQVTDIIQDWIERGAPLPDLQRKLGRIEDPDRKGEHLFSEQRAAAISTTEVTRLYAEGNVQAWQSTGTIGGKRWMTANDEKVCPICRPLHQKIVQLDGGFDLGQDEVANSSAMRQLVQGEDASARRQQRAATILRNLGPITNPPAHVNCRCWLQPVVDLGLVRERRQRELGLLGADPEFGTVAAELRARADLYVIGG